MYPGTQPGFPAYRRETWPKVSFVLLGFVCMLQTAAFCSPGWLRTDSECGNIGLVYSQDRKADSEECEYKTTVARWGDLSDEPIYRRIELRYRLADDVLCCWVPILLCFTTLIMLFPIMRGTAKKDQLTGLSIQLLSVANVLQWNLVYRSIVSNLLYAVNDNGIALFPYSLFLFGFGTFLTSALSILHLVMYLSSTKNTDKPYRL